MKKLTLIALSLALFLPSAAHACDQGPETYQNLLANDSVETDAGGDGVPDGWSLGPGVLRVATFSHTGAMALAAGGAVSTVATQNLTLLPNTVYTMSGHVRSQGLTGQGVRFRYVENLPANQTHSTAFATGAAGWASPNAIFTTAGNHGGGRFEVEFNLTAGNIWVDDVSICRGGDACSRPRPLIFSPTADARGAPRAGPLRVTLSEPVPAASFSGTFNLAEIAGPDDPAAHANPTGPQPNGVIEPAFSSGSFTFTPTSPLKSRTWYRMHLESFLQDLDGETQLQGFDSCFQTAMDRAAAQTVADAPGVTVEIPAYAMEADGRLDVTASVPSDRVAAANRKLSAHAGDPGRTPVAVADLTLLDDAGRPQSALAAPASLRLAYSDADGDGVVDGTAPPVPARTLAVYKLDETRQIWTRLFPSTLDAAARRVAAETTSFGVFALIGQTETDLSAATAFPVPFRTAQGHTRITFANLGRSTRVRVYTPAGELVREMTGPSDTSQLDWDVTNGQGTPVASGVYYYTLESGPSSKEGKLVIVR